MDVAEHADADDEQWRSRKGAGQDVRRRETLPEYIYGAGRSGNDRVRIELSGIDKGFPGVTGK